MGVFSDSLRDTFGREFLNSTLIEGTLVSAGSLEPDLGCAYVDGSQDISNFLDTIREIEVGLANAPKARSGFLGCMMTLDIYIDETIHVLQPLIKYGGEVEGWFNTPRVQWRSKLESLLKEEYSTISAGAVGGQISSEEKLQFFEMRVDELFQVPETLSKYGSGAIWIESFLGKFSYCFGESIRINGIKELKVDMELLDNTIKLLWKDFLKGNFDRLEYNLDFSDDVPRTFPNY